ncbi:MAG TPA: hypothetical protein VHF07_09335 [Nitrospiraceae bacterium]|nr:hypothetical protein [Nitrospiraceae bacterium]
MSRDQIVGKCVASVTLGVLLLAGGCAGRGDLIPVNLAAKPKDGAGAGAVKNMAGPRVSVIPFEDGRADRSNIGSRKSIWGGESHFNVPSGNPGEETAQALADYLKRKGWQAQYSKTVPSSNGDGPDIVLSGKILDLNVDAKGGFGSTDVNARSKLAIQAKNRADDSSITDTLAHSGTYSVFWFEPKDGEDILAEVLEKNFERFVLNTKFEDRSLRFR